jgi:hypothetical protein
MTRTPGDSLASLRKVLPPGGTVYTLEVVNTPAALAVAAFVRQTVAITVFTREHPFLNISGMAANAGTLPLANDSGIMAVDLAELRRRTARPRSETEVTLHIMQGGARSDPSPSESFWRNPEAALVTILERAIWLEPKIDLPLTRIQAWRIRRATTLRSSSPVLTLRSGSLFEHASIPSFGPT